MKIKRRKSRVVKIGKILIGGNNPVAIQSMAKSKTSDTEKTIRQINELAGCGCEIVRLAVKDMADARAIKKIKAGTKLPIVADIHFNWQLALGAIESGADKIRLNPGNIYRANEVRGIISALKDAKRVLRVGLNSGSVKYSGSRLSMADKLVKSCLDYIKPIERLKFYDIVISLKASTVLDTIEAYRKISKVCDYPLHLGVTATGSPASGAVKSSIALGSLLLEGIGDTLRVSLTDEPAQEVKVAQYILRALGLRSFGAELISCPTCGRCEVDLVSIVKELEDKLPVNGKTSPVKVAVMGCVVNGPGEAKEADIGVAFGKKEGLFFKHGRPLKKISFSNCADLLLKELKSL
ncbi:MAG TPA: flavodoxin-dependent (E)-4-hydroxy-3-methylbut-2-enyl-diphosphate synthase [Candidatus Margulisiibacteriota bacterium]|nr:flavodoxin-dependent (E)-4-hydroxy-3-methylbut-2-enyl-diphosphate synthase [Candidatus Margulisiibacteriota bacterium]